MSNTNNMSNRETINGVIAFLQASNNEDIALDLANAIVTMDLELERVKGIARDRLDRIAQLQHQLAVVEDKLEDTRSELVEVDELSCQGLLDALESALSPAGNDGLYGAYLRGELD